MFNKLNLMLAFSATLLSCAPFNKPQFRMPASLDVEVLKWEGSHPTIRTKAICYNQNKIGFTFKGGEATIYLDTLKLGKAKIDTSFYVPAGSEFKVPAYLKIDMPYLSTHGLRLDGTIVTIRGKFKGSVMGIVKTMDVSYKGKHDINLIMKPF
ncbi:LEA14-like dessication related protein [Pedobacter africanus]|uniref:LEA14-like dessication related protein n=1 Tax=Pedobacter africanus TaxID=151894 RepID=A0ACC6L227_9SPHI|nr:LEA type 2 family protein [Pedobacter africanus]MDR6785386.1 LEA14-like dessication related protein [Pedobacter africanus]